MYSSSPNWNENTVTFNYKPQSEATSLDCQGSKEVDKFVEYDVSSAVKSDGQYSFTLKANGSNGTDFHSRSESNPPTLILKMGSGEPATPTEPRPTEPTTPTAPTTPPHTGGGEKTLEFKASADATVKSPKARKNYGDRKSLDVDGEEGKQAYIKFDVAGLGTKIKRAVIRFYVKNGSPDKPNIYPAPNDWKESTITYANRPGKIGGKLDTNGSDRVGSHVEYDVSAQIQKDGTYSFLLQVDGSNGTDFGSRESRHFPTLIIETEN